MKKILCLALAMVMILTVFAGCGKFDMEKADLASYVNLCDIEKFEYEDLLAHYHAYRKAQAENKKSFYATSGFELDFAVKAELKNEDGSYTDIPAYTKDLVEGYDLFRYENHVFFDNGITYEGEDASAGSEKPRLVKLGEAFSFTVPMGKNNAEYAGKTVKFTVTVKSFLPAVYTDSYIADDLQKFYKEYSATKDVVENGDTVRFDYTGKIDGVAFDGGTAKDYVLIIGENKFIPGFEEQLISHKMDEIFTIKVTFPTDFRDEDIAGKEAEFEIKIKDIYNDTSLITENTPFHDFWELKEYYRVKHYIAYAIVDYVADHSELVEIPKQLLKDFEKIYENSVKREIVDQIAAYAEQGKKYTKKEMKEMLYPGDSYDAYITGTAKNAAYHYIVCSLLMDKLNLTYSDRQYARDLKVIAADYTSYYGKPISPKEMEKMMGEEVIRLSFMDALIAPELAKRVVNAPAFAEPKNK